MYKKKERNNQLRLDRSLSSFGCFIYQLSFIRFLCTIGRA